MQRSRNRKTSAILSLKTTYVASVLSFLYFYPGVEELELTNMVFHMLVEHFIFASSGFLILSIVEDILRITRESRATYEVVEQIRRVYVKLMVLNKRYNRYGISGFTAAASILVFWHIPDVLVNGTLDPTLHEVMHLSYSSLGALVYMSIKQISRVKAAFILLGFGKVMLWSGLYLSMASNYVYKLYPLWQHHLMGSIMLAMVPFMDFGAVAYLLHNLFKREEEKLKQLKT